MPAHNPPRRITIIKAPFDYYWPDRSAVTCFRETGEFMVKAEVADYAVTHGYAVESALPKRKSQPRAKKAIAKANAGTDIEENAGMGGTGVAADDSAAVRDSVAPAAE